MLLSPRTFDGRQLEFPGERIVDAGHTLLLSPFPIRRLTGKSAAVVQQMVD